MKLLKCSAGLALCALLLAACDPPTASCDPALGSSGDGTSTSCQTLMCTGSMADCKNGAADGCETDTGTDINNCGGCGSKCPTPANGEAECVAGVCGVATCGSRYKDCNTASADGCEVDTFRDANNCGGCGIQCQGGTHAAGVCILGKCQLACQALYLDCNGDPTDGCETNGANDLANCGNCGNPCTQVGATTPACSAGSCDSTMCTGTNRTCQKGPIDSCEIDTGIDVSNCGACGKQCGNVANGTPGCANSNCGIKGCNTGFSDCDALVATGCEINTTNDLKNCSACGNSCPTPLNGSPSCVNSMCGLGACNKGFADCDKNPGNGCEINTNTDTNNCGVCGMACSAGSSCTAGQCTKCGDGVVQATEESDPPPGPFSSAPVAAGTCLFHFENVAQLYCNGSCSWVGGGNCVQGDANIFCKLRTGNPASTATSYVLAIALDAPGFACPGIGTNLGPLSLRGVSRDVYYQDSSILASHGAGTVITNPTCTNP